MFYSKELKSEIINLKKDVLFHYNFKVLHVDESSMLSSYYLLLHL